LKISLNLARPPRRLDRLTATAAPLLIILAVALLVRIFLSAETNFRAYRNVHRSAMTLQAEVADLQRKQAQALQVLHNSSTLKLYQQIDFLNSLILQKRLSLAGIALRVSKLLPSSTRLDSLALNEGKGGPIVVFTVEGKQDDVYTFLSNLEQSADFDAPVVTDQSVQQEGDTKGLILLTCSARYTGVAPSESKDRDR
jgi:hypothetical protein